MRHYSFFVPFFFVLSLGCSSLDPSNTVTGIDEDIAVAQIHSTVSTYFVKALVPELKEVHLVIEHDVAPPFIGSRIGGWYNPLTDTITTEIIGAFNAPHVIHEFLHRVWFQNFTERERVGFWRAIEHARRNDVAFDTRIAQHYAQLPMLNRFVFRTEVFARLGEAVATNPELANLPPHVYAYYERIFKNP